MAGLMEYNGVDPILVSYWLLVLGTMVSGSIGGTYLYPGETSPDRVEMAIGENVNISCTMHTPWFLGKSSADLYFVDGTSQEPVPAEDIVVVNKSTIVFMLRNATERQTSYICKIGKEAIMASKVHVGTPPKMVRDFNCRAYNYEYMLCNFTQPENPVLTQYNLTFHIYNLDYGYQPVCNYEQSTSVVCNITLQQKYNPTAEYLHFTLSAINALGNLTQRFDVNIWNSMILARPGIDFRVMNITTNMLQVVWKMPKYMDRLKALQWEIMLRPESAEGLAWLNMSDLSVQRIRSEVRLRLTDLPYAFFWYVLKLRVRVRSAVDAANMWSTPFFYRFRTAAKRPDEPPRTDAGSFYVDSTETKVRLYWEQISPFKENGANLTYEITEVKRNGRTVQLEPIQLELNSALFAWQKDAHYVFTIKSRNHVDVSLASSQIEIFPLAPRNHLMHTPRPIHNVYHAAERTYTLTWQPPESHDNLLDYTVYWCRSKRALQNACKGSIHFRRISKLETKFTTDLQSPQEEHTLNMAVSANYFDYNTGMHWTPCTVDTNSDLVKMEPEIQASSDMSIRVQWSPESVCPSILEGYNLTYCEIDGGNSTAASKEASSERGCQTAAHSTIINKNLKQFELSNLKPYTNYELQMFMFSLKKKGKSSDPLVVRTQEAAPSPPRQLQVFNITNTSATVSWLPPSQRNGIIRYYAVILNNEKHQVAAPVDDAEMDAQLSFTLHNLISFTAYKVYVVAHTVYSSEPSNDIHFTTLIGYPSVPRNIIVKDSYNSTLVQWSKPEKPAGRVEFYEVAVIVQRSDELIRQRITVVSGSTVCALEIPACIDREYKTEVRVRAVNAALRTHEVALVDESAHSPLQDSAYTTPEFYEGNNDLICAASRKAERRNLRPYNDRVLYTLFRSPWQAGPTYGCAATRMSRATTMALLAVALSLCVMSALYVARRKYNKMANIDYTLPPGLDSYPTKPDHHNNGPSNKVDFHNKEALFHNEQHNLLSSLGNDSGYLGDGGTQLHSDAANAKTPRTSESSVDSLVESIAESSGDFEPTTHAKLESAKTVQKNATMEDEDRSMRILPMNSGYIKPSNIADWSFAEARKEERTIVSPCAGDGGGYVSVGSIGLAPKGNNCSYVQPQAMLRETSPSMKCNTVSAPFSVTSDGYSHCERVGKLLEEPPMQCVLGGVEQASSTLLTGYVVQRDLATAYGRQC